MKFILIAIILNLNGLHTDHSSYKVGEFDKMVDCLEARDDLVTLVGRPIVNYQAVCVIRDETQDQQ